METPRPSESHGLSEQESSAFRSFLPEAIRYWEPRRIIYNFSLLAVCIAWFALEWQHFRPALTWSSLPPSRRSGAARKCLLLRRVSGGHSFAAVNAGRRLAALGMVACWIAIRDCLG